MLREILFGLSGRLLVQHQHHTYRKIGKEKKSTCDFYRQTITRQMRLTVFVVKGLSSGACAQQVKKRYFRLIIDLLVMIVANSKHFV